MSINDSRILVACPAQTDPLEGIRPEMSWDGFVERDLMLFDFTDTELLLVLETEKRLVSERDAQRVLRMSDCGESDTYVLIGKDGGVKRRWTGTHLIDDLFQTIDAMPMRRFEMREKR